MVPVIQDHVAEIDVVVRSCRAVDQYTAKESVPGLDVKVAVIPAGSVLGCAPFVGETVSRSDWTLGHARDAIVVVGIVLSDAMEMNRSAVVLEGIGYMYD